jgi:hypothetical protein
MPQRAVEGDANGGGKCPSNFGQLLIAKLTFIYYLYI